MEKKGQGNIWWIIAVAVIVLVVAIIMISIFSGKISVFQSEAQSCSLKGGVCKGQCKSGETEIQNTDCSGDTPKCCVGVFS